MKEPRIITTQTPLPESINDAEEAQAYIQALVENGEGYHPDDPAELAFADTVIRVLPGQAVQMDKLMDEMFALNATDENRESGELEFDVHQTMHDALQEAGYIPKGYDENRTKGEIELVQPEGNPHPEPTLYIAVLDHKHGQNTYFAKSEAGLTSQIFAYVSENWNNKMPDDIEIPENEEEGVTKYFECMAEGGEDYIYYDSIPFNQIPD